MPFNISIVIVNYNGKRYIDNLFKSIKNMETPNLTYEIIFVDNNSSDDSIEYLSQSYLTDFHNLQIVKPDKNLGFAGGNNYGVKFAKGEYVVFLNNDTAVTSNWLEELLKAAQNPNTGIVASKLVFYYDFLKVKIKTQDKILLSKEVLINGVNQKIDVKFTENLLYGENDLTCFGHTTMYIPLIHGDTAYTLDFKVVQGHSEETDFLIVGENLFSLQEPIKLDLKHITKNKVTLIQNAGSGIDRDYNGYDHGFCEEDQGQFDQVRDLDSCCGAAMMMERKLFEQVGGFDENFFMYYEDTDLSNRIKRLGYKLRFCPTALVRHIHTGSSQEWSPFFVYHVYRNRLLFIFKNFPIKVFIKQLGIYIGHVVKEVLLTRQQRSLKWAKVKALFDAFKLMPIYFKRR